MFPLKYSAALWKLDVGRGLKKLINRELTSIDSLTINAKMVSEKTRQLRLLIRLEKEGKKLSLCIISRRSYERELTFLIRKR